MRFKKFLEPISYKRSTTNFNRVFSCGRLHGKKFTLEFEDFYFGEPRSFLELCRAKKLTYDTPVYLKLKLINKKMNQEKKQDVYFFNLPKMTDRGTFIINGIERVVINQLVRAPGVYFTAEIDKTTGLYTLQRRDSTLHRSMADITINKNNIIEVKVNKKEKVLRLCSCSYL